MIARNDTAPLTTRRPQLSETLAPLPRIPQALERTCIKERVVQVKDDRPKRHGSAHDPPLISRPSPHRLSDHGSVAGICKFVGRRSSALPGTLRELAARLSCAIAGPGCGTTNPADAATLSESRACN